MNAAQTRIAARWVPPGATTAHDSPIAAVYTYDSRNGRQLYAALGYRGTARRSSFHYTFKTPEARDQYVAEFVRGLEASLAARQTRSRERSAWINPLKAGDILYSSWGYDQTNVDFYVVVKVSGRAVDIAPIAGEIIEQTHHMSGRTAPAQPMKQTGEPFRKIARPGFEGKPYISLTSYSSATIYDGVPKGCSWYA